MAPGKDGLSFSKCKKTLSLPWGALRKEDALREGFCIKTESLILLNGMAISVMPFLCLFSG